MRNNEIFSWREPPFDPTLKEQSNSFRITDCAVSRDGSRLVAATLTNKIMLYDLRSRDKIAEWQMEDNITSINFSADGEEMLVSMMAGKLLLLDCGSEGEGGEAVVKMRFEGVMQKEFVVRSAFGGAGENFVISGSEGMFGIPLLKWLILGFGTNGACADSRVLIWRRETGAQVACLEGHGPGTVNAVAWHPTNPAMFASAGDDRRVRM
jgi:WD40 repeat protein